ncbi:MAG: CIC family chloride channel protein [Vicingaceae bacterium]|jgi:CIC family chloride channel protein
MKSLIYSIIRFYHSLPAKGKVAHRQFLVWRHKHISERQFILLLSILIGFSAGIVAVVLKNMVHFIQFLLKSEHVADYENYLYFIYPGVGIALTVLIVKYVVKEKVGHGIPATLYAISKKRSQMSKKSTYSSIITSIITVGFGGSVGLEGPTVGTSSAIGSNFARLSRSNYKITTLMLGCGATGAMSGIFNAPIAAIVFALEVIMLDLTAVSLIPLLMASVSAALTSAFILGDEVLFNVKVLEGFTLADVPFYMLLGGLTGLVSVYFSKMYWSIENRFEAINGIYKRMLIGSIFLGVLIFFIPPLYGEGFGVIKLLLGDNASEALNGTYLNDFKDSFWVVIAFLILVVLAKVIATSITFGAGGIGGIFAPSLFLGSITGFVFSKVVNHLNFIGISERNFTLVGMAGLIAGVIHAPLTGLFLIAEITRGYELIIPLMITAGFAFMTSKYFNPHSLYTMQLAKRGELITHDKDKAVLTLMNLQAEVEKDFSTVSPKDSLRSLVKTVSKSKRNIFPVVNENFELEGVVLLDDIRQIMFQPEQYDKVFINEIMRDFPASISSNDRMDRVMEKFNNTGAWNLPVIDDGKYVGFVSKSKLFNAYRKVLQDFSHE